MPNIIVKHGEFFSPNKITTPKLSQLERTANANYIDRTSAGLIIPFDTFGDGWGFSIARFLRENGYQGYLRAKGHIIADQYPLALRSGFDDIEISSENAQRHGSDAWQKAYERTNNKSYHQPRLDSTCGRGL